VRQVTCDSGKLRKTDYDDRGDVALLPALVNPHSHLEFSDLQQPLGDPGTGFPDWIRKVIRSRQTIESADVTAHKTRAVQRGMDESASSGVVALGEIVTAPADLEIYRRVGLDVVAFRELLSNDPAHVDDQMRDLESHYDECVQKGLRPAVSPHAPYTVSLRLLAAACRWAADRAVPLAFHLAESVEEIELLSGGTGPFVELLKDAQAWFSDQFGGRRPIDYLEQLAICPRVAVIHGNYLDSREQRFMAEHRDHMSLVYCPRTHAYFEHAPYPLQEYVARGIHVAIGTDSRASNPDLGPIGELLAAATFHPEIAPEVLVKMMTTAAAEAIGVADQWGSLAPGKRAAVVAVAVDSTIRDPYEALMDGLSKITHLEVTGDTD
jgi:cytosine/adenosine deaminase-related metal-dependent hydrolase